MTARHYARVKRRQRRVAIVGLCFCVSSLALVDSIQIPTVKTPQEPDALSANDYGVKRNETTTKEPSSYDEFMTWCTQVLGIQTSLEIKDFEYHDFMRIRMNNEDDEELCDDEQQEENAIISVRGLAATHDISVGVSRMVLLFLRRNIMWSHHIFTLPLLYYTTTGRGDFHSISCLVDDSHND